MISALLLNGLLTTLKLAAVAGLISLTIGLTFGITSSDRFTFFFAQKLIGIYVFIFRSIPLYVQALLAYFVLPDLLSFSLSPFMAGSIALGICSGAYTTEIIRSAINAIGIEMWESGYLVGFSLRSTIWYIIYPQARTIASPLLLNEWEALLKSTSVLSTIGVLELTKVGMNIVAHTMQPVPIYLTIAAIYLLLSATTTSIKYLVQRYSA
jgi:His/Glu/Gln/Arg/opine family amino acid ABC transporter permease subunit